MRKLEVVSPVPADIDIANSVEPLHVSEIAKQLDLSPDHYDLYGKYKAKVLFFIYTHIHTHKRKNFEFVSVFVFLSFGSSRNTFLSGFGHLGHQDLDNWSGGLVDLYA